MLCVIVQAPLLSRADLNTESESEEARVNNERKRRPSTDSYVNVIVI